MEEYEGVKFKVVLEQGEIPEERISEFLDLDHSLKRFLHPKKNEGNLSIRTMDGFLIKRTGAVLTQCRKDDAVLVSRVKGDRVYAVGGVPSSESLMHAAIYEIRKDANIILHFHDEGLLAKIECAEVGPFPYGTEELAQAVGKAAEKNDLVKIKEHGLVLVAENKIDLIKKLEGLFE